MPPRHLARLRRYFSLGIDDDGRLTHLPLLLSGYMPQLAGVPGFLWRLATETEWRYERQCFDDVRAAERTSCPVVLARARSFETTTPAV